MIQRRPYSVHYRIFRQLLAWIVLSFSPWTFANETKSTFECALAMDSRFEATTALYSRQDDPYFKPIAPILKEASRMLAPHYPWSPVQEPTLEHSARIQGFIEDLRSGSNWDHRNTFASPLVFASQPISQLSSAHSNVYFSKDGQFNVLEVLDSERKATLILGVGRSPKGGMRVIIDRPVAKSTYQRVIMEATNTTFTNQFYYSFNNWVMTQLEDSAQPFHSGFSRWRKNYFKELPGAEDEFIEHDQMPKAIESLNRAFLDNHLPERFGFKTIARSMLERFANKIYEAFYIHENREYMHLEGSAPKTNDRLIHLPLYGFHIPELTDDSLRSSTFKASHVGPIFNYRSSSVRAPVVILLQKLEDVKSSTRSVKWSSSEPVTESLVWWPGEDGTKGDMLHHVHVMYFDKGP